MRSLLELVELFEPPYSLVINERDKWITAFFFLFTVDTNDRTLFLLFLRLGVTSLVVGLQRFVQYDVIVAKLHQTMPQVGVNQLVRLGFFFDQHLMKQRFVNKLRSTVESRCYTRIGSKGKLTHSPR